MRAGVVAGARRSRRGVVLYTWKMRQIAEPPPPPRTNRTRRVPRPVLIGHAASPPPPQGAGIRDRIQRSLEDDFDFAALREEREILRGFRGQARRHPCDEPDGALRKVLAVPVKDEG
jgi:hypothetical protein